MADAQRDLASSNALFDKADSKSGSESAGGQKELDAIADRIKSFGDAISAKQMGEAGSAINDVQKGLKIASECAADVARNLNNVP